MKIVGNTVGMGLPKPNLKQTDPKKGDYVKGKDEIPSKVSQLENDSGYLAEGKLPEAVNAALEQAKASGAFDGTDGKTPNIWLAPQWNSADGRQDYIPMGDLVGVAAPSTETVLQGDIIICGQDGGILYVDAASNIVAGGAVSATAGANAPDNWQDGAAVKIVGAPGKDGVSPNLSIGTVTTLTAGSEATAEIIGQSPDLKLNLGIPRGENGSGTGGSGAPSDWSVNNENAEGYVKNRTHWKVDRYSTEGVLAINKSDAAFEASDMYTPDGRALATYAFQSDNIPAEGAMVYTAINALSLGREAKAVTVNGFNAIAFGNLFLMNADEQDTGENWYTLCNPATGEYVTYTVESPGTKSLNINWSVKYYRVVPMHNAYRFEGELVHDFDLGKGELTPGASYLIWFVRSNGSTVKSYATIDDNRQGAFMWEENPAGTIRKEEDGHIRMTIDFGALGCSLEDGGAAFFDVRTYDDPEQLYEWHRLDENYLPKSIVEKVKNGAGGKPDWNAKEGEPGYIANRTHWVEGEGGGLASNTLTYDGNKQGRAGVDIDGDGVYDFVKMSDIVPSPDQLVGAKLTISTSDGEVEEILTADLIMDMTGTGMMYVLVSPTVEMAGMLVLQDVSEEGMTVEKGIYFSHYESPDMSFLLKSITATTPIFGGGEVIHKLDNKFLDLEWMATKGQEQYEGDVLLAVEFNGNNIGGGYNYADSEECVALGKIKEGDNVVVIWDGKEYALTAQKVQFTFGNKELTVLTVGNIGGMWLSRGVNIGVPATGEPFSISFGSTDYDTGVYSDNCTVTMATEEGEGTHTVSIYAKSTLERMPEKYLPESVASKEYVAEALEELGSGGNGDKEWTKETITLTEDVSFVELDIPSAKRLFVVAYIKINNADNSLTTGIEPLYIRTNGFRTGQFGTHIRNNIGFYHTYELEKIGSHDYVKRTNTFDNGVVRSASSNLLVNGWKEMTGEVDTAETINRLSYSTSTSGNLFKVGSSWEVYYK